MKIRNPELIGDIAILFLTIGIFSWSFYNIGARNSCRSDKKQIKVLSQNNMELNKYLKQVYKSNDTVLKRLGVIEKKLESIINK